jgi:hypothetical protein
LLRKTKGAALESAAPFVLRMRFGALFFRPLPENK